MKKYYLFAALAATALASCTNDDFVGDVGGTNPTEPQEAPIVFTSSQQAFTRADDFTGAEAAAKLGNKFVVSGYKGAQTTWNDASNSIVFDNYLVEYAENTANTTESNSANWEYVGKTPIAHATTNGITKQTIKYWDYSKDQYDFFAWSTGSKTPTYTGSMPSAGSVDVTAMTYKAATGTSGTAYTFQGAAADLAECYISDLVTVKKAGKGTGDTYGVAINGYNNAVTLKFRQLGTKVRFGIYETVPGYSVKDVKFYTKAVSDANTDNGADNAVLFTTTDGAIRTSGKYTVYFPTVDTPTDADNNQAHIIFDGTNGTSQTTLENGTLTNNYTIAESGEKGDKYLGRTSNTATFAGDVAKNYYKIFLPNEVGANLNLRVNYTLESIDGSGEIIEVKGATAQVPSIYAKWLPGYAYTYLFKISDKTNGYTGVYDPTQPDNTTVNSDPAGLYPITFDAIVVNAEDGNGNTQETITTVSAPSITTYQKGSNVVNANEYTVLTANTTDKITGEIYVTVNDGVADASNPALANGALQTLRTAKGTNPETYDNKVALYTLPAGKTEAEVIDALTYQDDDAAANTVKGRSGLVLTEAALTFTNEVHYGVDGNSITVGTDKAVKFVPTANTTYAFVYTKTASTSTEDKFQAKTFTSGADVNGYYRYALVSAGTGDAQKGVTYFANNNASTAALTPFIGQGVSNLYTLSGSTYTVASGYAKTNTDYYYTIDGGRSYKKAHNVNYSDFSSATLYTEATGTTAKSETEPVDGTAYYWKDGNGDVFYCVILPQQVDSWYVIDETAAKVECGTTDKAVTGMTYFDKYTYNTAVRYAKIIKVQ